jgi:hypothetical protein
MPTVFMWYFRMRGKGRIRSIAGRSLGNRLHSVMRCWAICSAFSGPLHSGVARGFLDSRHIKVVKLSALRTGRL